MTLLTQCQIRLAPDEHSSADYNALRLAMTLYKAGTLHPDTQIGADLCSRVLVNKQQNANNVELAKANLFECTVPSALYT